MADMPGVKRWDFEAWAVACAFTADGRCGALALGDGRVVLVGTDGEARPVEVHKGAVLCLAPAADGFLTGGDDGRLCKVGLDGGVTELQSHGRKWVEQVAAQPGGAVASAVGKVVYFQGADHPKPWPLAPLPGSCAGLTFSPNGLALAAAHYGGVTLWPSHDPSLEPQLIERRGGSLGLRFSPDGRFLAVAGQENQVTVRNLPDEKDFVLEGYSGKVESMDFTAGSSHLVTSGEQAVVAWPLEAMDEGLDPVVFGAMEEGLCTAVACHPALNLVAAGFTGGAVFLGDLNRRAAFPVAVLGGEKTTSLAWSPDGRALLGGTSDGGCFILDLGGLQ